MRSPCLALLAALVLGIAHAQPPFADVPPGHWAAEAVEEVADACIVPPFGEGAFRGDDSLTRYELADVAGRLLDAVARRLDEVRGGGTGLADVEAELAGVAARLHSLAARADGIEAERQAVLDALEARVAALEAEVARLWAALEGRGPVEIERVPEAAGVPSGSVPSEARPDASAPGAGAPPRAADASVSGSRDVEVAPDEAPSSAAIFAPPLARPARPWSVAVAVGAAPQGAPLVRVVAARDDLLAIARRPVGVRASVEAASGGAGARDWALAAHLTRRTELERFGAACWRSHVGVGGGYRFDGGAATRAGGPFLGVILGAERWVREPWGLFVEASVEVHPASGGAGTDPAGSPVRPSLVVGVNYRF